MSSSPFSFIFLFLSLGIILAEKTGMPAQLLYCLSALCLIFSFLMISRGKAFILSLAVLIFFHGALLSAERKAFAVNHICRMSLCGKHAVVKGRIVTAPQENSRGSYFIMEAQEVYLSGSGFKSCGRVLVTSTLKNGFFYGEKVALSGRFASPSKRNYSSSRTNYRDYLAVKDVHLMFRHRDGHIRRLGGNACSPVASLAFRVREKLYRMLSGNLQAVSSSLLSAVLLGKRKNIPASVNDSLVNTGTVHIAAISGMHLDIISFMLYLLLKACAIPRKARYAICFFALIFYCIFCGCSPPVVRATIMACLFIIGYLCGRQPYIHNLLFLTGSLMLFYQPRYLFDPGFQMSFLSVFSLVRVSCVFARYAPVKLSENRVLRAITGLFCASFSVWLVLLPVVLYHYRVFSPVSIIANVFILPYMVFFVGAAAVFICAMALLPGFSRFFSEGADGLVFLLVKLVGLFERLPCAYLRF